MRENPADREDERIQRYLWLDQWMSILDQKGKLRPDLVTEFVGDLKSFIEEPPMSERALQVIIDRSSTLVGKNVAYYQQYVTNLKSNSVDQALGYLRFIQDDHYTDYYQRAQELLNLQSEKALAESRKIGVLVPLSGELQKFGEQVLNAIDLVSQLAISDGIEFVIQDTGETEDSLLDAYQRLALNENVSAVIGPVTSKASQFVFERAQILGVPTISLAPTENMEMYGPYSFQSTLSLDDQISKLADFISRDLRAKNVAVVFPDSRYGWDSMKAAQHQFNDADINIQEIQIYQEGDTDFKAELQKITRLDFPKLRIDELCPKTEGQKDSKKGTKANESQSVNAASEPNQGCVDNLNNLPPIFDFEVLFVPDFANTVGLLLPSLPFLRMYGVQVVGLSSLHDQKLIDRGQSATEGVIFTDGFYPEATDIGTRFFVERYKKLSGEGATKLSAEAFDVASILVDGMKTSTGPVTRDSVFRNLRGIRNFPGVTGRIYSDGQQIRKEARLFVVRDGKFKVLQ